MRSVVSSQRPVEQRVAYAVRVRFHREKDEPKHSHDRGFADVRTVIRRAPDRRPYVRHRLIAVTDQAVFFDGITFAKNGPEHHSVHLRLTEGERKGQIITVHQSRKNSI